MPGVTRRRPTDPEPESEWQPGPATLDPSGRVTKRAPAPPHQPPPAPPPPPEHDEPLELAVSPEQVHADVATATATAVGEGYQPLPNAYAAPKRSRSFRFLRYLLFGFVLLVLASGAAVVLTHLDRVKRVLPPAAQSGPAVLRIESEPEGAAVWINGREVGQTPLAQENDFPPGVSIPVKLTLRGHLPWTGSFQGGAEAAVKARLVRR